MGSSEWALLLFTLFAQTAVGLIFSMAVMSSGRHMVLRLLYTSVRQQVTVIAILLMAAAVLFSFFHLGSPLRAVYAMSNLQTSWLGREILMVIVFSGILAVRLIILLIYRTDEVLNRIVLWICFIAGYAMIYTMARVYMIPTIPAWNQASTMVLFFSSSFLLGIPLFLSLLIAGNIVHLDKQGTKRFFRLMVSFVLFAFLARLFFASFAAVISQDAGFPPAVIPVAITLLHYLFNFSGLLLLLGWGFISGITSEKFLRYLVPVAFSCLLLGEVLGRYIFFSGYYRIGV
jgi:anaerobic dimethyl sulfoxide reductase subunit C